LVGIKIARTHDASGIDNISVYIGQTIPEAGTVKGLIAILCTCNTKAASFRGFLRNYDMIGNSRFLQHPQEWEPVYLQALT